MKSNEQPEMTEWKEVWGLIPLANFDMEVPCGIDGGKDVVEAVFISNSASLGYA